ncbi:MAG TPA: urease accessory protein, partial [Cyanobacteria bacterium UBA11369]|nr:urease accessory protein [Cyanobacteria bacterium UBA11369]
RLFASEETINSPHSLARYPIVASLTWVGQAVTPELVEKARNLWLTHPGGGIGVTRLTQGLLCRYRGNSTTEVRHWFIAVWDLLRQSFLARPAILPRVWQMAQKP